MKEKLDTKPNKSKKNSKLEARIDDHYIIIYETLIHKKPI